ncbi:hypothetical protein [Mycobacteroides abscessus]|uniref:hypothetical protein n=1 Tax=Mycobacteroides abscessus TaxID=36809 RepID=UPI0009C4E4C5|nr:hypothetical protein [Mycobacteroides abscessus]SLG17107.1 Uncharacterised protein [Mycobacteroides abscessus subsp. abscessus]
MDIQRPHDDPFGLVGDNWVQESESAYTTAESSADDAGSSAASQARVAMDAASKMVDEKGHTADSVSGAYGSLAGQLLEQSRHFTTIAAWMTDTASEIRGAKKHIASLVATGTSEIKDALTSELQGTPITPSSNALITQYQGDIARVKTKLETDLDAIGHSLAGTPGSTHTPSYVSVPVSSTPEHADPRASMASYTGTPGAPVPEPHQLPPMPRATTTQPAESPNATSTPSAPAAPHSMNPTLANLIGGGQGSTPTGTPSGTSATHTPTSPSTQSTQSHQPTEQHQAPRPAGLPHIPSLPLPNIPAAAESIATAVSSATAHQLPTAPSTTITPSTPASTGITPGTPGTPPVTPVTPAPLAPIGGGGLSAPAVTQPVTPVPQATPAAPSPQQTSPRSPVVDATWLQRTYGLSPSLELPKPENTHVPARFIADLPESEAHLYRVLATLRQEFGQSGWSQPLAVATIRRGFETKTVYVTADAVSIHPAGVLLPHGVLPLDESPSIPTYSEMAGSIMVTEKLAALLPRGWEPESLLSTVPGAEQHQTVEQFQELSEAGELLDCKVYRGREGVTDDEALRMFARAAIGSRLGCSDLGTENARIRSARWIGTQPVGYGEVLSRWYLADAAESMSLGNWSDAVYSSEKYLSVVDTKKKVA